MSSCQGDFLCDNWNVVKSKMLSSGRKRSLIINERRGNKYINATKTGIIRGNTTNPNGNPYEYSNLCERQVSDNRWEGRGYDRDNRIDVNKRHFSQSFANLRGGNKKGCFNCGEFNHVQSSCRYAAVLQLKS